MHVFLLIILCDLCVGFFKNPPLQLSQLTNRNNLTCSSGNDADNDFYTNCEYCVYEFFNNGTDSSINYDCIYITNTYRRVTQRCSGFTSDSDTGYGLCSALFFEYFDINVLCICATDLCNENFTTCKQSVDSNPNVAVLPSPIPSLNADSGAIECVDTPLGVYNTTYYCLKDSTTYINLTQCEEYVRDHTVLCMYIESDSGNYLTLVALPDEDYEYVLADQLQSMEQMESNGDVQQFYNETSQAFYVEWNDVLENSDNRTVIYNKCYCTTNNCNNNLSTCLQAGYKISEANRGENWRF